MSNLSKQQGFNLIELMFGILIMAITVNYATPTVQTFMEKNQLKQASERIFHFYRYARSEAIKQNKTLFVTYNSNGSSAWAFALAKDSGCLPTDLPGGANTCLVDDGQGNLVRKGIINGDIGASYPQVTMMLVDSLGTSVNLMELALDPVRGSSGSGGIELATANGWRLKNTITPLGDMQTCVPVGAPKIVGYQDCA